MKHSPLACRLLAVLAATTIAAATADAASSPRRFRPEPGSIKTVAVVQPAVKARSKAPAPAPQAQPNSHGNQDGDRFLYDSCGCSGGH